MMVVVSGSADVVFAQPTCTQTHVRPKVSVQSLVSMWEDFHCHSTVLIVLPGIFLFLDLTSSLGG